jgi:hypothetical protein
VATGGVLSLSLAVVIAAAIPVGGFAVAAEPATTGTACPDRPTVLEALRKLSSPSAPEGISEAALAAGLDVVDLGDRMRVAVAGRSRDYVDSDRNCERRARVAAVFVALVLSPDRATAEQESTPAEQRAEPTVAARREPTAALVSEPPAPRSTRLTIEAAPVVEIAGVSGSTFASAGVEAGVGRPLGSFGLGLSFTLPIFSNDAPFAGTRLRLERYPVRLIGRRAFGTSPWRLSLEGGAVGAFVHVTRVSPPPTAEATRFEPAAHAGLEVSRAAPRMAFYVNVTGDFVLRTNPLALDPEGHVGTTPRLWFAGGAGLRFAFH